MENARHNLSHTYVAPKDSARYHVMTNFETCNDKFIVNAESPPIMLGPFIFCSRPKSKPISNN